MPLDHIRQIYGVCAPRYDASMRLTERLVLAAQRRTLLQRAHGAVLEVAMGTGVNLPYYPSECRITGLDLVPEMLALAERRAHALNRPLQVLIDDATNIPAPDGAFDTVVTTLAACTFPEPVAALREMARVCRPDGRVLLLEHVRGRNAVLGRCLDLIEPLTVAAIACHPNRDTAANVQRAGLRIAGLRTALGGILLQIEARTTA